MTERVAIGYVCEKGNHVSFVGEDLSCGAHYYATIYVTLEKDRDSLRGDEPPALEHIKKYIGEAFRDADAHAWCNEKEEQG